MQRGLGDAFSAGLMWAHLTGLDMVESLQVANACGAQVVSRTGVLAALPTLSELHAFRATH